MDANKPSTILQKQLRVRKKYRQRHAQLMDKVCIDLLSYLWGKDWIPVGALGKDIHRGAADLCCDMAVLPAGQQLQGRAKTMAGRRWLREEAVARLIGRGECEVRDGAGGQEIRRKPITAVAAPAEKHSGTADDEQGHGNADNVAQTPGQAAPAALLPLWCEPARPETPEPAGQLSCTEALPTAAPSPAAPQYPVAQAFGGLSILCALASHPDTTDMLMGDAWEEWTRTWVHVFTHELGMSWDQRNVTMNGLLEKLNTSADPEQLQAFHDRMDRLTYGSGRWRLDGYGR